MNKPYFYIRDHNWEAHIDALSRAFNDLKNISLTLDASGQPNPTDLFLIAKVIERTAQDLSRCVDWEWH